MTIRIFNSIEWYYFHRPLTKLKKYFFILQDIVLPLVSIERDEKSVSNGVFGMFFEPFLTQVE